MAPLRVLYITFGDAPGGAEVMLQQQLQALEPSLVEPHVLVSSNSQVAAMMRPHAAQIIVEPKLGHIVLQARNVTTVLSNSAAYVQVIEALSRRLRKGRFDLLHACGSPTYKYGGIAARIAGIPAFATLYDVLDGRLISPWSRRLLATNLNFFYRRIFVPAHAVRRSAVEASIDPARISVLRNGIDMNQFRSRPCHRQAIRAEMGVSETGVVIGTVGRLIPLKGQDLVIRAAAPLLRDQPDSRLLVVGGARTPDEKAWQEQLQSMASELNVQNQVAFTGWRTDTDRLYQAMDIFVHAPRLPDSSPVVLIEAMAVGLACVAADIGGIAEIVTQGDTGLLVAPSDVDAIRQSVETLISNGEQRAQIGARGRAAVVDTYDKHLRTRELERAYSEVCRPIVSGPLAG